MKKDQLYKISVKHFINTNLKGKEGKYPIYLRIIYRRVPLTLRSGLPNMVEEGADLEEMFGKDLAMEATLIENAIRQLEKVRFSPDPNNKKKVSKDKLQKQFSSAYLTYYLLLKITEFRVARMEEEDFLDHLTRLQLLFKNSYKVADNKQQVFDRYIADLQRLKELRHPKPDEVQKVPTS